MDVCIINHFGKQTGKTLIQTKIQTSLMDFTKRTIIVIVKHLTMRPDKKLLMTK